MRGHISQAGPPSDVTLKASNILIGKSLWGISGACNGKCIAGTVMAIASSTESKHTLSTTMTKVSEVLMKVTGMVTVKYEVHSNSAANAVAAVYVNGSIAPGTFENPPAGTSLTYYSYDISVNAGDLIQIYLKCLDGVNYAWIGSFNTTAENSIYSTLNL